MYFIETNFYILKLFCKIQVNINFSCLKIKIKFSRVPQRSYVYKVCVKHLKHLSILSLTRIELFSEVKTRQFSVLDLCLLAGSTANLSLYFTLLLIISAHNF